MLIFLDSANPAEIENWNSQGIIDGVTTNPSIMFKDGMHDLDAGARTISRLLGDRPLSVEVTGNDRDSMLEQAFALSSCGKNIVIKIPVVNEYGESCLGVIKKLSAHDIAVNATAILSFNQAMLATKAGATYVSIFAGRVADEGNDSSVVVRNVRHWLDDWHYSTKIIVGSIRAVIDIQNAALAGAHVITIPPAFLPKMIDHAYTRETVRQFNRDAEKTLNAVEHVRTASTV